MRKYGRVDGNHREIAEAFRNMGCSFLSLASLGDGAPDAAVGYGGLTMLIEIKNPAQPLSKRKLKPDQVNFWETWRGGIRLIDGMQSVIETVNLLIAWKGKLAK